MRACQSHHSLLDLVHLHGCVYQEADIVDAKADNLNGILKT